MTAQEYITDALIEIGTIMVGATPDSDTLEWGLRKFNRLLDTLSVDGINLYYRVHENFPTVAGTSNYTIGVGGTVDTDRPILIETAYILDSGYSTPLFIKPISVYWELSNKEVQGQPGQLFLDTTSPLGVIYLHHSPNTTYDIHIISQKPLSKSSALSASIVFPPEYEEMLITKLATRLAPRFGIQVSRELVYAANEAYSNMRARNFAQTMKSATVNIIGGQGLFDINEG